MKQIILLIALTLLLGFVSGMAVGAVLMENTMMQEIYEEELWKF